MNKKWIRGLHYLALPTLLAAASIAVRGQSGISSGVIVQNGYVLDSSLFALGSRPVGFGAGTSGGRYGKVYMVTSSADDGSYGTLRYGVQNLAGPRWIVFDPNLFPPGVKTSIYLNSPLRIDGTNNDERRDNHLTIDGRGSYVSLRRNISWNLMQKCWYKPVEDPNDRKCWDGSDLTTWSSAYECFKAPNAVVGPLINIRSAKNVIITHIDFAKFRIDTPPPTPTNPHQADYQCFEDMITIFNGQSDQTTENYNFIWINRSEFRDCGDECVTATAPSYNGVIAGVTVSRNLFANTYKGLMFGNGTGPAAPTDNYGLAGSVYQNRFVNVRIRQPRVQNAYADVFNNLFENWLDSAVSAKPQSRVMVEQNVFRAVVETAGAWGYDASDQQSRLWARDNILNTGEITGTSRSPFPACAAAGGPFYNDCSVPMTRLSLMTYPAARDWVRARAGWENTRNDVRDAYLAELAGMQ
jgi:pectate lyase